jgi:AraC family transcriptional regulator, regulatory protein of adaptative response / DNA-3-methyladenine glycosylase II
MSVSIVPAPALQADVYARALDARDARFDGIFFVGIITTRIYCRPVCPARVSYHDHRRFFRSAAAAERAGFRPCMRCRPELAPGLALIDAVPRLARDAANRIAAGALNGHSVAELANDLGVSERHLRRALEREIGASPLELAQTYRLLLAKRLLADTGLSITRIAYASGFQSLRRFNAAFRAQYRMAPSALRITRRGRGGTRALADDAPVRLSLAYRAPFAWDALLAFLGRDAVDGIDVVDGNRYGRTVEIEGHSGFVFIENGGASPEAERAGTSSKARTRHPRRSQVRASHVDVAISPSLVPVMMPLLARLRQVFDLDAEPTAIDAHLLQGDLGTLVSRHPGVRIPGAFDGFDLALRTILRGDARGRPIEDVSSDLASRVAQVLGEPIETGVASLSRLPPTASRLSQLPSARLEALGVPRQRANAVIAVARLVVDRQLILAPGSDPVAMRQLLAAIDGVGDQLATNIVMRALSWPDVLPVTDPALQSVTGVSSASDLHALAEQWRPWRSYAALHLWLEAEAPSVTHPLPASRFSLPASLGMR